MGFLPFNDPPHNVITEKEFERVLSYIKRKHTSIPHEQLSKWKITARGYFKDFGKYRGMDIRELEQFASDLHVITDKIYRSVISGFIEELRKALKATSYGNPVGL